eukprot:CAMPEP_0181487404 /NCGR_PEP_ID=MMETSP1110-20121109/47793_1 /TAXON_ID=174948 /ORGANISM="Symbiodinium sp., Strain CCMP421" /LENGTH=70 /DNA_ID=CAMNT_0023613893 /DNA_START=81 /DNA_END=293 /DNA_ORIENTATION=-
MATKLTAALGLEPPSGLRNRRLQDRVVITKGPPLLQPIHPLAAPHIAEGETIAANTLVQNLQKAQNDEQN